MNLLDYDSVVINLSGGKDSQMILGVMMNMAVQKGYSRQIIAVHADTGAEWPQSLPHCQMLCKFYGIDLVVANPFRKLPEHIERRCRMMAAQEPRGKPGWPSPAQRYCTSDCKRNPIQKAIRALAGNKSGCKVLTVTGERRQESSHRAKLPEFSVDTAMCVKGRTVHQYRPILDAKLEDVWRHIAETGLPRHPAYDLGNERVSCAICVLAKEGDICNGARACPELAEHYLRIERELGFTFMHKKSLKDILERGKQ